MDKKILIFGGSGFIGTYLCKELIASGFKVTVADIVKPKISVDFIDCDIQNKNAIKKCFSNSFDYVFNMAGIANLELANENPINAFNLNVVSNMYIIEQCVKNKVKRFLYASSAYAMSEKGSFYGITKLASEKLIEEYGKKFGLNYTIIRYGSVYSENDFNNNYIFELVSNALKNNEIIHFGDGNEFREYIHAEDAAKLSVDIINSNDYINRHLILTGSQKIKRIDLFNMINEILGGKIKITLNNKVNTDHYKFSPYTFSSVKAVKLTPNPQIDLGQGIIECLKNANNKN